MGTETPNDSSEQDWRLKAEFDAKDVRRSLHDLVGRLRGPAIVKAVEASVPHDVVITHDGKLLFAYAADQTTLKAARSAIENALQRDGIKASMRVSHWDDGLDDWRQTDPPATAQEKRVEDATERDAETIETRTLVVSSGKLIRAVTPAVAAPTPAPTTAPASVRYQFCSSYTNHDASLTINQIADGAIIMACAGSVGTATHSAQ